MNPKIKKCPFCGGKPKFQPIIIDTMRTFSTIRCRNCGADITRSSQIRGEDPSRETKVIKAWNKRTRDAP